ncbi:lipopolysaccharide-induced tumor necrosis factor-alpha factor homolog [Drosophila novamexicana]|uniref:lipopolysaccharide-induced tumor necrosis factor-alpha factor homolog n=1 Tax=Drosophila novamexicana TaxID=47314 RepID=UPI0011E5AE65|nr:lipopolysaccharide-induced tumor necrosis factor-alpha factor homolog [Drosophila novamexicana]
MEKQEPPPYTEQPLPETQPQPMPQATPQAQISFVPAQAYQPYPTGPTQPPLYPPMQQQQQPPGSCVLIHTTQPIHVPVGRDPTFVRCPTCRNDVVTTIQNTPTGRTHMWALLLCLIGCWPCVCVPYCVDSCKTANHYCPVCNAFIGSRML